MGREAACLPDDLADCAEQLQGGHGDGLGSLGAEGRRRVRCGRRLGRDLGLLSVREEGGGARFGSVQADCRGCCGSE